MVVVVMAVVMVMLAGGGGDDDDDDRWSWREYLDQVLLQCDDALALLLHLHGDRWVGRTNAEGSQRGEGYRTTRCVSTSVTSFGGSWVAGGMEGLGRMGGRRVVMVLPPMHPTI